MGSSAKAEILTVCGRCVIVCSSMYFCVTSLTLSLKYSHLERAIKLTLSVWPFSLTVYSKLLFIINIVKLVIYLHFFIIGWYIGDLYFRFPAQLLHSAQIFGGFTFVCHIFILTFSELSCTSPCRLGSFTLEIPRYVPHVFSAIIICLHVWYTTWSW